MNTASYGSDSTKCNTRPSLEKYYITKLPEEDPKLKRVYELSDPTKFVQYILKVRHGSF